MGSDRELSHVSEGALIKATQATCNAVGSAWFARKMLGEQADDGPEGAAGAILEAAELLEYATSQIEDEWDQREVA